MIGVQCQRCVHHAEATFRIDEMDCAHEVAILERRLGRLDGIAALDADVLARRLRVHFDAASTDAARIAEAVAETGMRAWPVDGAMRTVEDAQRTTFPGLLGGAVGAGVLAMLAWALAAPPLVVRPLLLATIALALPGTLARAWKAARGRRLDIHVLMVVAVVGALAIDEWFEAAAVVVLFGIAQWLETRSLERARRAVREVLTIVPEMAEVRGSDGTAVLGVRDVAPGTLVIVRPGSRVPLDGVVVEGESTVDQSAITGESVPVERVPGEMVFAGSVNGDGVLVVRTERPHDDTVVARMLHMVEQAQSRRAHVQTLVDRFAAVYTPVVLVLAALVAIVPPLVTTTSWASAVHTALVLLVISCPCALVIATPVAVVSALSAAARRGLLVKGGNVLERLATVRTVVLDKTGTLTEGLLDVERVDVVAGMTPAEVLRLVASVEQQVHHPVAGAVVRHAEHQGIALATPISVQVTPGGGVSGRVDGHLVLAGSLRWLGTQGGRDLPSGSEGPLSLGVVVDGRYVGGLLLRDRPRQEAPRAMARLRAIVGDRVWMLSGDAEAAVAGLAGAVGVDHWRGALLPDEKVTTVEAIQRDHGGVLMVGDGVNDGPALATAHVGLAMGGGTDVAFEAADGALMYPNLSLIPYAIALGRRTVATIRVNVVLALVLKLVVVVLAAMQMASLWLAVAADVGASLVVVAISLRLLRFTYADSDAA
jgi:Cd2+/Zn2+-exporting ATPase